MVPPCFTTRAAAAAEAACCNANADAWQGHCYCCTTASCNRTNPNRTKQQASPYQAARRCRCCRCCGNTYMQLQQSVLALKLSCLDRAITTSRSFAAAAAAPASLLLLLLQARYCHVKPAASLSLLLLLLQARYCIVKDAASLSLLLLLQACYCFHEASCCNRVAAAAPASPLQPQAPTSRPLLLSRKQQQR